MDRTEKTLKAILYRLECPSKMDLGEYDLGLLDIFRRNEIAAHTATCPLCQADLVQMRLFMALPLADEVPLKNRKEEKTQLLERIKVIVVDLLAPPAGLEIPISLQPAMRGETQDMSTRVFHVDPYVIALSAMKEPSSWQKQHIIGDIIPATDDEENFQHWTVYLWRAGKLLDTSAVDRDSHFFFEDVQFDNKPHDLILSGPKVEIHLQNLLMA